MSVENGRCLGVDTPQGPIGAGTVVCAVGGYVTLVAAMVGLRLPIVTHPLQAFVTEAYKPVLDRIVASPDLLVYVSQSARGELLVGAEIERYPSYSTRSTFTFLAEASARCIDLFPFMAKLRILRQWTGVCDMTPDYSPLMGIDRGRGLLPRRGLGHLGLQGHSDRRRIDGRADRDREGSTSHRPVRARPVSTRPGRLGACVRRYPLTGFPPG